MNVTGCETLHCNAGWRDFSFLKVTTDEGITGISEYNECYGSPGLSGVIERFVANWVVGEDPMAVTRVGAKLYAARRRAAWPGRRLRRWRMRSWTSRAGRWEFRCTICSAAWYETGSSSTGRTAARTGSGLRPLPSMLIAMA